VQARDAEAAREKEAESVAEHKEWIAAQKRALLEAKVQREIARHAPTEMAASSLPSSTLPGAPYSESSGFVVFWDFAGGMPRQLVQCTAVYAFYDGHTPKSDVKSLPPTECEPEPGGLTRAIFSLRRQFLHMEPHSSVQLVVEVQQVAALPSPPAPSSAPATRIPHAHAQLSAHQVVAPPSVAGGVAKTTSLGWTSIPVFHQRALNAGFWKLQLYRPPISVGTPLEQRVALGAPALFVRLVLTEDMERNRAFAVDPERTSSIYRALVDARDRHRDRRPDSRDRDRHRADSPDGRRSRRGSASSPDGGSPTPSGRAGSVASRQSQSDGAIEGATPRDYDLRSDVDSRASKSSEPTPREPGKEPFDVENGQRPESSHPYHRNNL
jgi:hypothetical protein|tara:strand:+ start:1047 stop:2192 length:1146 start_codon:yes stop_codon:yes gene_type:complete